MSKKTEVIHLNREAFVINVEYLEGGKIKATSLDHPEISFEGTSKRQAIIEIKKQIIKKLF